LVTATVVSLTFGADRILAEEPVADAATARHFNRRVSGNRKLREEAAQTKEDLTVLLGFGQGMPFGPDFGGATPDGSVLRAKACAADVVLVARPQEASHSAFSEDGSTIFTVRGFSVERALRQSSVSLAQFPSSILVATLGGSVNVNGHTISVRQPSVPGFQPGRRYLLFLTAIPGSTTFWAVPGGIYDIGGESVVSARWSKALTISPAEALQEIEDVSGRCPKGPGTGALEY
jgi:hypothetical protein